MNGELQDNIILFSLNTCSSWCVSTICCFFMHLRAYVWIVLSLTYFTSSTRPKPPTPKVATTSKSLMSMSRSSAILGKNYFCLFMLYSRLNNIREYLACWHPMTADWIPNSWRQILSAHPHNPSHAIHTNPQCAGWMKPDPMSDIRRLAKGQSHWQFYCLLWLKPALRNTPLCITSWFLLPPGSLVNVELLWHFPD